VDSLPLSRVENSQPEGIGRLVSLDHGCAWNNLGRNVVFADESLGPLTIFGDTRFPDDDEASQFDLDVHAIVELAGTGTVAVLNHHGLVRIFDAPWSPDGRSVPTEPNLGERRHLEFAEDVERVVGVGDRLVTSRPRGRRLAGVLVTEPLVAAHGLVGATAAHESFGFVSALTAGATAEGTDWVALGGEGAVRVVEADRGQLGATRWESPVDFTAAVLVESGTSLWAAGSASGGAGVDDYRWDRLKGGGLTRFDLADGAALASARFAADLAWGSGGVPLVVVDGVPCGVGRRGELHVLPTGAAATTCLTRERSTEPLGIAHAAVVGDQLVVGFNRGGYELHVTPLSVLRGLLRDLILRRA
jgi:hypothetical protein